MLVIAKRYGQMANCMILHAHCLAAGFEHGFAVANPAFFRYAQHFPALRGDLWGRYPSPSTIAYPKPLRYLAYRATYYLSRITDAGIRLPGIESRVMTATGDENVDLETLAADARDRLLLVKGWQLRAPRCVEKHGDALRTIFRPDPIYQARIDACIEDARAQTDLLIGVHIRQGDYQRWQGGRYYYSATQYARLMRHCVDQYPNLRVGFLICSNAPQEPDHFAGLSYSTAPGHPVEDLFALAACDRIIGPPSTYSIWAAFYGQVPLYQIEVADHPVETHDFRHWSTL